MNDHDTDEFEPEDDDFDYSQLEDEPITIPNQVFPVSGNKIQSLLTDDQSLRFSGGQFDFPEDFEKGWQKKWTTNAKLKVSHRSIRSISKEDGELKIRIVYRTYIGIPSECEFCFYDPVTAAAFLAYMEKEQYFTYTHEKMSRFMSVWRYLLGLAFTIAMTWFCWYLVVDGKDEGTGGSGDYKERIFFYLLGILGTKGILAIGIAIVGYIGFKIWKRAGDPPFRTKLIRA